jgi:hypothetical protein
MKPQRETGRSGLKGFLFQHLAPIDDEFDVIYLSSGDECFHECFQKTSGELKAFNPEPLVADFPPGKLRAMFGEADLVFMNETERMACERAHGINPKNTAHHSGWYSGSSRHRTRYKC